MYVRSVAMYTAISKHTMSSSCETEMTNCTLRILGGARNSVDRLGEATWTKCRIMRLGDSAPLPLPIDRRMN